MLVLKLSWRSLNGRPIISASPPLFVSLTRLHSHYLPTNARQDHVTSERGGEGLERQEMGKRCVIHTDRTSSKPRHSAVVHPVRNSHTTQFNGGPPALQAHAPTNRRPILSDPRVSSSTPRSATFHSHPPNSIRVPTLNSLQWRETNELRSASARKKIPERTLRTPPRPLRLRRPRPRLP